MKSGLVLGPSLVLALAELAQGLWAVAIFVVAIPSLTALAVGSMLRTRVGAAVFGVLLAVAILLFLLAGGWLISHPIQRGD